MPGTRAAESSRNSGGGDREKLEIDQGGYKVAMGHFPRDWPMARVLHRLGLQRSEWSVGDSRAMGGSWGEEKLLLAAVF